MGDGVHGDDCTVQGDLGSGLDDCAKGYFCNLADANGENGTCYEMCNTESECVESNGVCKLANGGVVPFCADNCNPVLQNCPNPEKGCFVQVDIGLCRSPGTGGQGDSCEFGDVCASGFHCFEGPSAVDGCDPDAAGCCTAWCDITEDPDPCAAPNECVAFEWLLEAPPGSENFGICVLP